MFWCLERTGKKLAPEKLVFRICEVLPCFHRDKLNYFVSQRILRIIFFAVHQSRALGKSFRLVQEYLVFCDAGANKLRERFTSDWLFLGKCILNHSSEQNDKVNDAEINQESQAASSSLQSVSTEGCQRNGAPYWSFCKEA